MNRSAVRVWLCESDHPFDGALVNYAEERPSAFAD